MEEGYRLPRIEEFVDGFEYQVKKTYRWMTLGAEQEVIPVLETWEKGTWRVYDDNKFYTETMSNGGTLTMSGRFMNFTAAPFVPESFIEQGIIRISIAKYGE